MTRYDLSCLQIKFDPETRERLGIDELFLRVINCLIAFVLPVSRLTPLTIERWGIVAPVTSHLFPRSYPVVIVEIRDLFLEFPFEGAKLEKVTIKLPHEMTSGELIPNLPLAACMSVGGVDSSGR
jgi:hypothetical protein